MALFRPLCKYTARVTRLRDIVPTVRSVLGIFTLLVFLEKPFVLRHLVALAQSSSNFLSMCFILMSLVRVLASFID